MVDFIFLITVSSKDNNHRVNIFVAAALLKIWHLTGSQSLILFILNIAEESSTTFEKRF